MEIKVKIPIKADIVFQGLPIITSAAGSGTTWTKEQLGDYADRSGVNIHHCDGKILYVGKTTSGQERKKRPHNTRFILFGHSASAFAKAVAIAKDNYFRFANYPLNI